jgi:hypothetical protein
MDCIVGRNCVSQDIFVGFENSENYKRACLFMFDFYSGIKGKVVPVLFN